MVAESGIIYQQSVAVNYLCVDVSSAAPINSSIFRASESSVPIEISRVESALSCSTSKFAPTIRSGSHTDIGPRKCNEDQHICIDDLSTHMNSLNRWSQPSSFYALFDGHGGPDAATYLKNNAVKFLFEDSQLPQTFDNDEKFLHDLEISHRHAFLLADHSLAQEQNRVDSYCGTTALTAMVLGRHLLVANAGDCRAVLCRKGDALQLSQDHRPSLEMERKRVEDLGGTIEDGYLNGELAVTRALGDWYMKLPFGSKSPLSGEPEFRRVFLGEDDEFLIIGCDGIWDVMSNQEAVRIVRSELRLHNDPQKCARELVNRALLRDTCDNVTVIVVCFSTTNQFQDSVHLGRPRLRFCMSEEARDKLRSLLQGN